MENQVISYLPNCPTHNDDDLHKERNLELIFETLKSLEGVQRVINLNVKPGLTLNGKGAFKEEMT